MLARRRYSLSKRSLTRRHLAELYHCADQFYAAVGTYATPGRNRRGWLECPVDSLLRFVTSIDEPFRALAVTPLEAQPLPVASNTSGKFAPGGTGYMVNLHDAFRMRSSELWGVVTNVRELVVLDCCFPPDIDLSLRHVCDVVSQCSIRDPDPVISPYENRTRNARTDTRPMKYGRSSRQDGALALPSFAAKCVWELYVSVACNGFAIHGAEKRRSLAYSI
ncbi:hypothetical protein BIW11_03936 [Tropilaelaps mercedesae]|uniref:Uncharacterized protein n=1 Tax=Tropilaelaps mercedesae TaxID=418985 RepID=A0A1V9XDZ2_9ACAR|nr:hypothetical protein BIW11_03936 [Tropilaelaps mercedesae]